jgi:hypothetical protein
VTEYRGRNTAGHSEYRGIRHNPVSYGNFDGPGGYFVARRLAAPLVGLSKAATEFASGNLIIEAKVGGLQKSPK